MNLDVASINDPRIHAAWPHPWSLVSHQLGWCYVGSLQHGTHGDVIDDVDLFAVVSPPPSLWPFEHWVYQHEDLDVLVYSWAKYLRLLAKSNPNMLATLDPEVGLWSDDPWLRKALLRAVQSKAALKCALGYAQGQYAKLEKGTYEGYMGVERKQLFDRFGYDPKAAAHSIRILRFALDFADGHVRAQRPDAALLREVKQGAWSKNRIAAEFQRCESLLADRLRTTAWPDEPDRDLLDEIYAGMV